MATPGDTTDSSNLTGVAVAAGLGEQAIAALRSAVALDPELAAAWLPLSWHLIAVGDLEGGREAMGQYLRATATDPPLRRAATALCNHRLPEADLLLREYVRQHPTSEPGLRLLAEATIWRHRDHEALGLLTRCLELAPDSPGARFTRAVAYYRLGQAALAQADIAAALITEPQNPAYRAFLAAVCSRTGEDTHTLGLYAALTTEYPSQPKLWMSYGHMLKAAGQQTESVAAYRRTIELDPHHGEAWWSLANLKTVRFDATDIEAMLASLQRPELTPDDRLHFEFAVGKALEDARRYAESFQHYATGNRLRSEDSSYLPVDVTVHVRRCKDILTREFFAARAGQGCPARDPIFIIGLPRAGSTLLEQILSSHSAVEGTTELPDITGLARRIAERETDTELRDYVHLLGTLSPAERQSLGESYLTTTQGHRKLGRAHFIDKMPNNFGHIGLIHLILPNARIIDARRHPLASCFSNFKQHFAVGQLFSYGLEEIGRYYRDYVELMAHIDAVLPGRVHRVYYERMVNDTEQEVRRLLDYCGLPFEAGCLRFYENDRVVRTASSEQVRQPIYREGVDHWRHFEPWLGPLQQALGPVLEAYPEVPDFPG